MRINLLPKEEALNLFSVKDILKKSIHGVIVSIILIIGLHLSSSFDIKTKKIKFETLEKEHHNYLKLSKDVQILEEEIISLDKETAFINNFLLKKIYLSSFSVRGSGNLSRFLKLILKDRQMQINSRKFFLKLKLMK